MHNLIEFIKSHFHWVMFVLLESAAIVLLFRFNDYQASIWFTSANEFTAAVDRTYADVVSYIKLGKINSDLTARNIMLQRQVNQLRDILAKQGADSLGLDEKQKKLLEDYKLIPAQVTSNSINKENN